MVAHHLLGCVRAFSVWQPQLRWNDHHLLSHQKPQKQQQRLLTQSNDAHSSLLLLLSSSSPVILFSSFASDSSEYAADRGSTDDGDDDAMMASSNFYRSDEGIDDNNSDEDETPTIELQPVPISKNSGNRFVAIVWDRIHRGKKLTNRDDDDEEEDALDVWDWHEQRVEHTEDHVMFCRKQNLYNETFNTESMVDILWSLQM
jgi:hypothetical protein